MYAWLGWLVFILGVLVVVRLRRRKKRVRDLRCAGCGYSREGRFERCPECGTAESDQSRLWKKKYRVWYAVVLLVAALAGYVTAHWRLVYYRGWDGFVPTALLMYLAYEHCEQWATDTDVTRDTVMAVDSWWSHELDMRLWPPDTPRSEAWLFRKMLWGLRDTPGLSIEGWENVCGRWVNGARYAGGMSESASLALSEGRVIELRDWWIRGGTSHWRTGDLWLLQGKRARTLEIEARGASVETVTVELEDWLNKAGKWESEPNEVWRPGDGVSTIRYTLREDRDGGSVVILEREIDVTIRYVDEWDEEAMPAARDVMQTAAEWAGEINPDITLEQLPDGTCVLGNLNYAMIRSYALQGVAFGVHAGLRINGEVVRSERAVIYNDPLNHWDNCYNYASLFSDWAVRLHDPDAPGLVCDPGDTFELVLRSDREMALEDLKATSYWEGEVVVPITRVQAYPAKGHINVGGTSQPRGSAP